MNSIVNFDLKDEAYNKMLVSHLISDDFFDVVNHPTAAFRVSSSKKVENAPAGEPNVLINGTLQLTGTTKPLSFLLEIVPQADRSIKIRSSFDLDRTQWGIIYGSGRFFEKLGMHLVSNMISIELFLTAKPG
jgi:polyisoprenoid-binding protein YceI